MIGFHRFPELAHELQRLLDLAERDLDIVAFVFQAEVFPDKQWYLAQDRFDSFW